MVLLRPKFPVTRTDRRDGWQIHPGEVHQGIHRLKPEDTRILCRKYILKDADLDEYVSEYRKYTWGFDDFFFNFASGEGDTA